MPLHRPLLLPPGRAAPCTVLPEEEVWVCKACLRRLRCTEEEVWGRHVADSTVAHGGLQVTAGGAIRLDVLPAFEGLRVPGSQPGVHEVRRV